MTTLKVKTKRPMIFGNQQLKAEFEFEISDFLAKPFAERGFFELLDMPLPMTDLEGEPKHKKAEKRK